MEGVLEVINLLGLMNKALQQQLSNVDLAREKAEARVKELEETNERLVQQSRKREGK